MSSLVFYRKWRPQTLSEVVGQEHVTQTLRNAVRNGQIAHAYLFCGSRGTGKTSTGRILAKAVNCLNNNNGEPCNKCIMCQAITDGKALDVIEIDAASNNSVDDIRSLREKINFVPNMARYKVYIIDEVHMLSDSASNALLKTLEEPPQHAIFILATTETHKIIPTILSRCQRFDFRRISPIAAMSRLEYISRNEGITIDSQALKIIARNSAGSLRDAENLLEQLLSYYGSTITTTQVQDMLGLSGDLRVKQLINNIFTKNVPDGLTVINSLVNDGIDLKQFNRELIQSLRDILMIKSGINELVGLSTEDMSELNNLSSSVTLPEIIRAIKLFGQADLSPENYYSLPLELALIECTLPSTDISTPISASEIIHEAAPEPVLAWHQKPNGKIAPPTEVPLSSLTQENNGISSLPTLAGTPTPLEKLKTEWKQLLDGASQDIRKTAGYTLIKTSCTPIAINDNVVILEFEHKALKEKMELTGNRKIAEKLLSDFLGHPHNIQCVIQDPQNKQNKKQGYLVKAAIELGAEIIDVEDKK